MPSLSCHTLLGSLTLSVSMLSARKTASNSVWWLTLVAAITPSANVKTMPRSVMYVHVV